MTRLIEIVPRFASFALLTDLKAFSYFIFFFFFFSVSVEGMAGPFLSYRKNINNSMIIAEQKSHLDLCIKYYYSGALKLLHTWESHHFDVFYTTLSVFCFENSNACF